jgi:hypothetical protein
MSGGHSERDTDLLINALCFKARKVILRGINARILLKARF